MAVEIVLFTNKLKWTGTEYIHNGRKLVDEFSDTEKYKTLKPGDVLGNSRKRDHMIVKSAVPFIDELKVSFEHTFESSSVMALYSSATDTFYPMFIKDFIHMSTVTVIDNGRVNGEFGYIKKNKTFGIKFLANV